MEQRRRGSNTQSYRASSGALRIQVGLVLVVVLGLGLIGCGGAQRPESRGDHWLKSTTECKLYRRERMEKDAAWCSQTAGFARDDYQKALAALPPEAPAAERARLTSKIAESTALERNWKDPAFIRARYDERRVRGFVEFFLCEKRCGKDYDKLRMSLAGYGPQRAEVEKSLLASDGDRASSRRLLAEGDAVYFARLEAFAKAWHASIDQAPVLSLVLSAHRECDELMTSMRTSADEHHPVFVRTLETCTAVRDHTLRALRTRMEAATTGPLAKAAYAKVLQLMDATITEEQFRQALASGAAFYNKPVRLTVDGSTCTAGQRLRELGASSGSDAVGGHYQLTGCGLTVSRSDNTQTTYTTETKLVWVDEDRVVGYRTGKGSCTSWDQTYYGGPTKTTYTNQTCSTVQIPIYETTRVQRQIETKIPHKHRAFSFTYTYKMHGTLTVGGQTHALQPFDSLYIATTQDQEPFVHDPNREELQRTLRDKAAEAALAVIKSQVSRAHLRATMTALQAKAKTDVRALEEVHALHLFTPCPVEDFQACTYGDKAVFHGQVSWDNTNLILPLTGSRTTLPGGGWSESRYELKTLRSETATELARKVNAIIRPGG